MKINKMKEIELLIAQWQQRQHDYEDLAERYKDHPLNNRKYVYKALATRDCWKELLALQEKMYSEEDLREAIHESRMQNDKGEDYIFEQFKKK
jgi:hypothetical protein